MPGDIRGLGASGVLSSWTKPGFDAGNSYYNPYGTAPGSSHVLWTYQVWSGGVIGGEFGDLSGPDAYTNGRNTGTQVMNGIAYVTINGVVHAIDVYTGEDIWAKTFPGTIYLDYQPNIPAEYDRGIQTIIYSVTSGKVETYSALDGGLYVPGTFAGGTVTDSRVGISVIHEGAAYYTGGGYLLKWWPNVVASDLNATGVWWTTKDPMDKMQYRVQIPSGAAAPSLYWEDIGVSSNAQTAWNLTDGTILWNKPNQIDTIAGQQIPRGSPNDGYHEGSSCVGDGKYYYQVGVLRRTVAIDLYTGEVAWVSEPRTNPYGAFSAYQMGTGQGNVFVAAYDGVWAYNTATGTTSWHIYAGDTGETPYGVAIADGKVYVTSGEHSSTNPQHKGNRLYCLDNDDGSVIWSIAGGYGGKSVADDKLFVYNENKGQLFCFGRGETATTVTVSSSIINLGSKVLITGTVTDQSPGAQGTPCVSSESMTAQMEYLYMMRPKPTDSTGVPVDIYITNPDGTCSQVGTATTDINGNYAFEWTPQAVGMYTVNAYFAGTAEDYFPSDAGTVLSVDEAAPTTTLVPTTATPSPSETSAPGTSSTDLYIIVAVVVIVLIIAVAAVVLRRNKTA